MLLILTISIDFVVLGLGHKLLPLSPFGLWTVGLSLVGDLVFQWQKWWANFCSNSRISLICFGHRLHLSQWGEAPVKHEILIFQKNKQVAKCGAAVNLVEICMWLLVFGLDCFRNEFSDRCRPFLYYGLWIVPMI